MISREGAKGKTINHEKHESAKKSTLKPSPSRLRFTHKYEVIPCCFCVFQKAPQARYVSNRRWSANAVSAKSAESVQPLQGWMRGVRFPPVPFATLTPPTVTHIMPLRGYSP